MCAGGDAKPDGEGEVGLLPDARDEGGQLRRQRRARPRDTRERDAVEKGGGDGRELLDALIGGGGGEQGNVGELVLRAEGDELVALLGGQVHHDEAGHA
eukprot:scaffold27277_cov90-Isochrysis_galbana.AAC.1